MAYQCCYLKLLKETSEHRGMQLWILEARVCYRDESWADESEYAPGFKTRLQSKMALSEFRNLSLSLSLYFIIAKSSVDLR